ncbi:ubiquitin-protein ligase E3 [Schizosaccharomyces cryophilus OY26]|uniref:Ubiquitin-protein ligase E3 n=1 Tax=Schizosaccharomyces cryophilus (strain OY26 / ATCC MYA-4695 / CBS 11777 / NBRC 106824 / NRRL Y48691) TaxID=653667 RepID=S9VZD0_SCHCR|nr:ubiquitin-protein ligase E3 [Schizosaccharomyces cryophilus OY26]EPY51160.1 ubiquitin-protein ligase E3 [Schizosaccharomyces cryophilus OY26]
MSIAEDWVDPASSENTDLRKDFYYEGNELNNERRGLFSIEKVQLQFPVSIRCLAVENNILVMALTSDKLMIVDLEKPEEIVDIELPKKALALGLTYKIFLDPSGQYIFVTTTAGDNCLFTPSRQGRVLTKLKGHTIESMMWRFGENGNLELLLASRSGAILDLMLSLDATNVKRLEKSMNTVYSFPYPETPLDMLLANQENMGEGYLVVATNQRLLKFSKGHISSMDQLYFFSFFQGDIDELYRIFDNESVECVSHSPYPQISAEPYTIALKTNKRIVYYDLINVTFDVIQEYQFVESPRLSVPTMEMNLLLTPFHTAVFDLDTLYIFNRVSQKEVYQQKITLSPHEEILGLSCDHEKNTYWLYTTDSLHELVVNNELDDVAIVFLQKAEYLKALACANTPKVRNSVLDGYADHLMKIGDYEKAATFFAETYRSVEEVALSFIEIGQKDVLRQYLWKKVKSYKPSMKSQREIIVNWLLESLLGRLNDLDEEERLELFPDAIIEKRQQVLLEFSRLLSQYKDGINRELAYNLANNYGKEEQLLQIATVMKDQSYIMHYWVQRENYDKALETLNEGVDQGTLIQHATALLTHRPMETVSIWERQADMDVHALIPSLLSYNQRARVSVEENAAIRYLKFVTGVLGCAEPSIHNTLFCIYACHSSSNESYLMNYIEQQGDHPLYDMDLGIRLCLQFNCRRSAVKILVLLKLYSQGVELALEEKDYELAASVANMPEDDLVLKKSLWQAITKAMFATTENIKESIKFLEQSNVLPLTELIRLLPEKITLDDLRDNICDELESCREQIEQLGVEIEQATEVAEAVRTNSDDLKNRYIVLDHNEPCWHCHQLLFSESFVLFPCQHTFHRQCMLKHRLTSVPEKDILKECQLCGPSYTVRLLDEPFPDTF